MTRPMDIAKSSWMLTLASIAVVIAALYLGKGILLPLTLAALLSFLLSPVCGWLERRILSGPAPGFTRSIYPLGWEGPGDCNHSNAGRRRQSRQPLSLHAVSCKWHVWHVRRHRAGFDRRPQRHLLGILATALVAVLVAAVFWMWLWGPTGLLLATPLTVCLLVIGKHVPQLSFLNILLGTDPVFEPKDRIYQRLLAGDQDAVRARSDYGG